MRVWYKEGYCGGTARYAQLLCFATFPRASVKLCLQKGRRSFIIFFAPFGFFTRMWKYFLSNLAVCGQQPFLNHSPMLMLIDWPSKPCLPCVTWPTIHRNHVSHEAARTGQVLKLSHGSPVGLRDVQGTCKGCSGPMVQPPSKWCPYGK